MKSKSAATAPQGWNDAEARELIDALWALRQAMLSRERELEPWLQEIDPAQRPSAANLAHYLALRSSDLRHLQERLARIGVSSLGRAETHVLANVDKVLGLLHRLAAIPWTPLSSDEPAGFGRGGALLALHAKTLFGAAPAERGVRIMVTLPSEAAQDKALVASLVDAGMDIARINCAHDDAAAWMAMARSVRRAARAAKRPVRVLMDLGGPKLRTGPLAAAPGVVKLRPERDAYGANLASALLGLRAAGSTQPVVGVDVAVGVDATWLQQLQVGDAIDFKDARDASRRLVVVDKPGDGAIAACQRSAYLTAQTRLRRRGGDADARDTALSDLPAPAAQLHLKRGDPLVLVADGVGHAAQPAAKGRRAVPATIACTLPEALPRIRKGERVWFDDGRIGGVVVRGGARRVLLQITEAREGGERLGADKGINLPDTQLDLPALTEKDLQDLDVVARVADLVGLSFAQSAADVRALRRHLIERDAAALGVILKIETRRGFQRLPEMLLAAMAGPAAGVMIARGDLAVECGYERMAEVQEQILWACEAAHMPVVWATQVLETLAKTGLPSRAEITDAAMGGRAECVMLNKGPHIVHAMRTLDDILRRMQAHQSKKRPLLRALQAWNLPLEPAAKPARKPKRMPAAPRPA